MKAKAIIIMLLAALGFTLTDTMFKVLSDTSIILLLFYSNLICCCVMGFLVKREGVSYFGKKEHQKQLIFRSLTGIIAMSLTLYSIQNMPIADATTLNKSFPFFVLILSPFMLKEKVTKVQFAAVILAFIGVAFIMNPRFNSNLLPAIAAVLAAFISAVSYIFIRKLSQEMHALTLTFYSTAFNVVCLLPIYLLNFKLPSSSELLILVLAGVFMAAAQTSLVYAYKFAPASEISIYNYSGVIFAAIIGYIFWKEVLGASSLIGICLVLISGFINYMAVKRINTNLDTQRAQVRESKKNI